MAASLAPGWFYRADFTRDPVVDAARRIAETDEQVAA